MKIGRGGYRRTTRGGARFRKWLLAISIGWPGPTIDFLRLTTNPSLPGRKDKQRASPLEPTSFEILAARGRLVRRLPYRSSRFLATGQADHFESAN